MAPPGLEPPAPPAPEEAPTLPDPARETPVEDGGDDVMLGGVDWVPAEAPVEDGGDDAKLGGVDWVGLGASAVAVGSAPTPAPDGAPLPAAVGAEGAVNSWFCASGDSEQPIAARTEQATRALGFIPKYILGRPPRLR